MSLAEDVGEGLTTEEAARAQGWRPYEEYVDKGLDPEKWVDADEFMRRADASLPLLRAQNRSLASKVNRLESQTSQMADTIRKQERAVADAVALAQRANQQGYERALAELKAQKREAVANADPEAFDRLEEQEAAMVKARDEAVTAPPPAAATPAEPAPGAPVRLFAAGVPEEYETWGRQNLWFFQDKGVPGGLNEAMVEAHKQVQSATPGMPLAAQLDAAKRAVMAKFPEKFGLQRREEPEEPEEVDDLEPAPRPAASVSRPSGGVAPRRARSGFDAIEDPKDRQEAREAFARERAADPRLTEDEYLAVYNNPHIDLLAYRAQKAAAKK